MLEIEQKYAHADFATLERRLAELGARPDLGVVESDQYFNAPDRDFARTGEAFRLRRIGAKNLLTYKGPREPHAIKTRTELEIALRDGEEAAAEHAQLLRHLGFHPVAVVRKRRRPFKLDRGGFPLEVCLDEVEELGRFAEVEALAEPDRMQDAHAVLAGLAAELGLTEVEQRSYLTLLLALRESKGEKGGR
jgi:adenylate cyclase class 2